MATIFKHNLTECKEFAISKGGECLSNEYIRSDVKMAWKCKDGHVWESDFSKILSGYWCKKCANNSMKLGLQKCNNIAISRGGICLSTEYINVKHYMEWSCEYGHKWSASFDSIKRGSWCPYCAGKHITLLDCQNTAKERGGICLSTEYTGIWDNMQWQCGNGHIWATDFSNIKNGKSWRPRCSGVVKHTIEECKEFAINKGGECLSESYISGKSQLLWKCSKGHTWTATFNNIRRGKWCPRCKGKAQESLKTVCEKILGYTAYSNYRGFSWLKTTGRSRQEIDIWFPDLKLAIEYDGRQHFEPVSAFGGIEGFNNIQRLDALKNSKIQEHKDEVRHFIRISYLEALTEENIRNILIINGVI